MSDLDITGRVVFDASQAEGALDKIGDKADQMAREVSGAATQAGKSVDKIGDGAAASADKFTRAESRIADSIKRTQTGLELLGKTASEKLEFKINAQGLDAAKFEPALAKLRETEAAALLAGKAASGSLNNIGVSAAQTANALRGVPAQFTDIVTSLQGGQAPLTVFLQQGGQLKDLFGGAGNAARALGGYVLGLVNPFTAAAAAIGAVGFAYYKGAQEIKAFENALALSGNASGVTVDQMRQLATTTGASADALAQFARAGVTGTEGLQKFSEAAVRFENFTGIAVNESVAAWKSLGDEPVKSALKLNDTISFLTPTIYGQIKALNDQGKAFEAAALAQDAFASAQQRISDGAESKLNAVSYGWDQIAKSIGGAWKALKDFTNGDSVEKRIGASQATIGSATEGLELARARGQDDRVAQYQKIIDAETKHLSMLQSGLSLEKGVAAEKAEQNKRLDGQVAFDREHDKYLSKSVERERELAVVRQNAARANNGLQAIVDYGGAGADAARKTLLENQKKLAEAEAGIGKKFEEKSSAPAKAQGEYDKLIASIKAKIALNEAEIATGEKQNEADKLRISLMAQIEQGSRKMTAARLDDAQAQLRQLDESEKAKALYLSQKKFEKERDKEDQSIAADIAKINERAQALEDEAKVYGMTATELQALTIARLEEKKALISGFDGSEKRVAQINDEIAALNRLASAGVDLADAKLADKTSEMLRDARAQAEIYEQENSLSGLTALERAKITAQRKVEYEYTKKIADVDKSGASDAAKTEAKSDLNEAKLIASSAAVNKVVQDEWQKTADSINNSLTDALLRGFESGKDFAANLRDTVVNMFKTLVLRPIISAVVNPVAGALTGALGLGGAANAATGSGIGGIGNLLGSGISSAITGGLSAGFSGLTGSIGSLFGAAGTGATLGGSLSAGVTALGAGNIAGGLSTLAGSLGPIALGAAALASAMKYTVESKGSALVANVGGGVTNVATRSDYEQTGGLFGGGTTQNSDWAKADKGVSDYISKSVGMITASNKAYADALGLTSGEIDSFTKAIEISITGLDAAGQKKVIDEALGTFRAEQAAATYGEALASVARDGETTAQTLQRLGTDLAGVNGLMGALGSTLYDVSVAGASAASGLAQAFGGLEAMQSAVGAYYDQFYSASEKSAIAAAQLTQAFDSLGVAMPASTAGFRALVDSIDRTTSAGSALYASVVNLAPAFASAAAAAMASQNQLLSAAQNWGSASDVRGVQAGILQRTLADSGLELTLDQVMGATQQSVLAFYKGLDPSSAAAKALLANQQAIYSFVGGKSTSGSTYGGRGGGGGGGGGASSSMSADWKAATDAIVSTMADLRKTLIETGSESFSRLQAQFAIDVAKAGAGDVKAAEGLPDIAKSLIAAGNGFNTSSVEQALLIARTVASLEGVAARAAGAGGQTGGGISDEQIVERNRVNLEGWKELQLRIASGEASYGSAAADGSGYYGVNELGHTVFEYGTMEEIRARIRDYIARVPDFFNVPKFANGGYHAGGWAMVGEQGPELVNMPPARVFTASDTKSMLTNSDPALVAEIAGLRAELVAIRTNTRSIATSTNKAASVLDASANGGQPLGMATV